MANCVLCRLFFCVPFIDLFLYSYRIGSVQIFWRVVNGVTLEYQGYNDRIICLIALSLSIVRVAFGLRFRRVATPARFCELFRVPVPCTR